MRSPITKPIVAIIIVFVVVSVGMFLLINLQKGAPKVSPVKPTEEASSLWPKYKVIGKSVEGRKIESYTYGNTKAGTSGKSLVFVGGMHGGYEWNSVLLAYQFKDYLDKNAGAVGIAGVIPDGVSVTVIPSANPDGVYKVTGKDSHFTVADVTKDQKILESARFNAHDVDLNRNFDCNWKPNGTWKTKTVSAGSAAFSEPEAKAFQNFVLENKRDVVVFWHSQANAVYASECNAGILPETLDIMNTYSKASGYPAFKTFDSYKVTGDAEGWLASVNIPAIAVELKTHETIEREQNLAGIKALFGYYSNKKD